ncbi:MAG: 4-oxalocrotonate tautomerase [Rhodoferax sp.]|uniref:4-oxalocrotonate tautomerase n=1 Tax=Rhodoferax sp. TaxID=50421 RepID=UPI00262799C5|nr:4-oxalocrotonate tautomerase [Rhodoferax sp.]MDD5332277.1 4-oxalocrotonate tautomerase [Rhodoferax sp.]
MPLTLTLTEGVLPKGQEKVAIARLTESFLEHHGMSGNRVMTPNITAHVNLIPKGLTFSGGKEVEGAWIETKTPSFALADNTIQASFFGTATQIIHDLSGGKLPKERIWTNGVHAVDGTWNINGVTLTNVAIGEAVSRG